MNSLIKKLSLLVSGALLLIPGYNFAQWTSVAAGTSSDLYSVCYDPTGSSVWVGSGGGISYSSNGGNSFSWIPGTDLTLGGAPIIGYFEEIKAFSPSTAVAVGLYNIGNTEIMFRTTNSGNGWVETFVNSTGGLPRYFKDVAFKDASNGVAVGANGRIMTTTNGGVNWTSQSAGTAETIFAVAHVSGNTYVAAGNGIILRSTDNGNSWNLTTSTHYFSSVSFVNQTGYMSYGDNEIYKTTNGGLTWTALPFLPGNASFVYAKTTDTLFAATSTDLFTSSNGGQYWDRYHIAGFQVIEDIMFLNSQTGMIAGHNGFLRKTANGGGAPFPFTDFTFPPGPFCANNTVQFSNAGNPAYTYQWNFGGAGNSSSYSPSFSFPNAGVYAVTLIATGTNGTVDSTTKSITISPAVNVNAFVTQTANDSVCYNTNVTVSVPNSQSGVNYRLRDGFSQIGTNQFGNGATLNFSTGALLQQLALNIIGTLSNGCSTDSLIVVVPVTVIKPSPATISYVPRDSICIYDTSSVIVANSEPGFYYRWSATPLFTNPNTPVQGTGSALLLPIQSQSTTHTFTVTSTFPSLGCTLNIPSAQTINVYNAIANVNITPNPVLTGQPVTITNTSVHYNTFSWDFGAVATPSTSNAYTPPPIVYNQPYNDSIRFSAFFGDSLCFREYTYPFKALGIVTPQVPAMCHFDSISDGYTITDFHLDRFNAKYITGYKYMNGAYNFDCFAAKLDSAGNVIWLFQHQPNQSDNNNYGLAITSDNFGNAFVTIVNRGTKFTVQGRKLFDPNILLCFDPDGKLKWSMTSNKAEWTDLIADSSGMIYTAGNLNQSAGDCYILDNSGNTVNYSGYAADTTAGGAFIMRFDRYGTINLFKPFGRTLSSFGGYSLMSFNTNYNIGGTGTITNQYRLSPKLSFGPGNSVLLAGTVNRIPANYSAFFGNIVVQNNVTLDTVPNQKCLLVASFDPGQGNFTYAGTVIGGELEPIRSVAGDASGNLYITGHAKQYLVRDSILSALDPVSAGADPLFNFLVKVTPGGGVGWFTHTRYGYFHDVEVVDDTLLYSLASFTNIGSFFDSGLNGFGLQADGPSDVVLLKYNQSGSLLSIAQTGTAGADFGFSMEKDMCGNIHTTEARNLQSYNYPGNVNCYPCSSQYVIRFPVYAKTVCGGNCFFAYDPGLKDAAADSLYLSDTSTVNTGNRQLKLRIRNDGQITMNSVGISYRINNNPVQSVVWNGSLPYADTTSVLLTTNSFAAQTFNKVTAWITLVNGTPGDFLENDTLSLVQYVCQGPLSGTYSIDPAGGDFESFSAASAALSACGISGPITLEAAPGIYQEQLIVKPIPGSSSVNTVTWKSAANDSTSVILDFAFGSGIYPTNVYLAKNVSDQIFRQLTMRRDIDTDDYNFIFLIDDSCHRVILENNHFAGKPESSNQTLLMQGTTKNDSCAYINNLFTDGNIGIEQHGNLYYGDDIGLLIADNTFIKQTGTCIELYLVQYPEISGNRFIADTLDNTANWRTLYVFDVQHLDFSNNVMLFKATYGNSGIIYLNILTAPSGPPSKISNNIMIDYQDFPYNSRYGLTLQSVSNLNIYHNTFDLAVKTTGTNSSINFNNNFMRQSAFFLELVNTSAFTSIDYNNYYRDTITYGASIFKVGMNTYKFSAWNTLGFDLNSHFFNSPLVGNEDYHYANTACPRGIPLPSVTTDIDGEVRSPSIPFIGADEFNGISDVWPGDANSDNIVNHYDLLPIGLFFGETGNPRAAVSNAWQAWACNDWGYMLSNGSNIKHADCNGDGIIGHDDTLAVTTLNYGLTHRVAQPAVLPFSQSVPGLIIDAGFPISHPGDTLTVRIYGGTANDPVNDLYALGLDMLINPAIIEPGTAVVSIDSCYFAQPVQNLQFGSINETTGEVNLAFSRINRVDTTGFGLISTIRFVVNNSITTPVSSVFGFSGYQAFNSSGTPIILGLTGDSITVLNCTTTYSTITASGCNSYTSPSGNYVYTSSGTYVDMLYNATGCDSLVTINLTISPFTPVEITGDTLLCAGDTALLATTSGYDSYLWSTGDTTSTIAVTVSGLYDVIGMATNGCQDTASLQVTFVPYPVSTITALGPTSFCQGDSTMLTSVPLMSGYQWYRFNSPIPGATAESLTVKTKGPYYCVIENASQCAAASNTILVKVPCISVGPNHSKIIDSGDLNNAEVAIYPNPVSKSIYIEADFDDKIEVQLYNATFELVYRHEFMRFISIDATSFNAGIYFYVIRDGSGETITGKLVKL